MCRSATYYNIARAQARGNRPQFLILNFEFLILFTLAVPLFAQCPPAMVCVSNGVFRPLFRSLTDAKEIYRLGCWLLARERLVNRPLRLLGLGVSGLVEAQASQLRLPLEH